MSLLDTLPSSAALDEELLELDLDFEPCDPCLALQRASCVDDVDVDIDIIDEEPAVADAAHPAPVPRARRRRRTDAVEHAPVRSRAEICTAAAKARWAKRRKKDEPEEVVGVTAAASSEVSSEAIVVWSGEHGDGLNRDSTLAVLSTLPLPVPSSTDATKELFQKMKSVMSRTALGSQLKMSDRTVQHRMRKMASVMFFASRLRMWKVVRSLHEHLRAQHSDYAPLLHLVKERFDEFSIRLRVGCRDDGDGEVACWRRDDDTIMAKLMQTSVCHAFLFRIDHKLCTLECALPSVLKPVESTHAKNIKESCRSSVGDCKWANETFRELLRISLHDAHASNNASDCSIFADFPKRSLLQLLCMIHHGHRACEGQWQSFPSELRGVLATIIGLRAPLAFRNWKRGAKTWLKAKAEWIPYEEGVLLPLEAQQYNDQVFRTWSHGLDSRMQGMRARERQKRLVVRKTAFSGILNDPLRLGHACRFRGCCENREMAVKKMCDAVDAEVAPKPWAMKRWLGSEDGLLWTGFWLACGGLLVPAVLIGWLKMSNLDEVQALLIEFMAGDVAHQMVEGDFEEVNKEMSDFERQTTYYRNAKAWLSTRPLPRMWILQAVVHVQQQHQKSLLRTSGLPFEQEQLERESQGLHRKLKPLIALEMEITGVTMKDYGEILCSPERWDHLPPHYKLHGLAMAGFRSATKSAALVYRTEVVRNRSYPFKAFGPASEEPSVAFRYATEVVRDREACPCVMDPWSYDQSGESPTVALQLRPQNVAKLKVIAAHVDLENSSTEADNAQDRRRIKSVLQGHDPHLTDITAHHLFQFCRKQRDSLFMDGTSSEEEEEETQIRRGGGSYRSWISSAKNEIKNEQGVVDFKKAGNSWKTVDKKSEVFKEIEDKGKAATKLSQLRAKASPDTKFISSNFGLVRNNHIRKAEFASSSKALVGDIAGAVASAHQEVYDGDGPGQLQLAVIKRNPMTSVMDLVAQRAGPLLVDQVNEMDKYCRAVAWSDSQSRRETSDKLRDFLTRSQNEPHHLLPSNVPLPQFCYLKRLATPVPRYKLVDQLHSYAEALVTKLTASRTAAASAAKQGFEDALHEFVKLRPTASVPDMPSVSSTFKATYCYKFGAGKCVCSGSGIIHDCFRRAFNGSLTLLCPPASKERRWLLEGWVCAEVANKFYHISDVMLSPLRVIVTKLEHKEDIDGGNAVVLQMLLDENGWPPCMMDIELARLVSEEAANMTLYKLRSTESPMFPFSLAGDLTFDVLHKFVSMVCNDFCFWKGAQEEQQKEIARRRKKAEAAAKRRARRRRDEQREGADPGHAEARHRLVQRSFQRPAGAGLLVQVPALPIADADAAAADGPAQVRYRLFADDGDAPDDDDTEFPSHADVADDHPEHPDEVPGGDGFIRDWNLHAQDEDEGGCRAVGGSRGVEVQHPNQSKFGKICKLTISVDYACLTLNYGNLYLEICRNTFNRLNHRINAYLSNGKRNKSYKSGGGDGGPQDGVVPDEQDGAAGPDGHAAPDGVSAAGAGGTCCTKTILNTKRNRGAGGDGHRRHPHGGAGPDGDADGDPPGGDGSGGAGPDRDAGGSGGADPPGGDDPPRAPFNAIVPPFNAVVPPLIAVNIVLMGAPCAAIRRPIGIPTGTAFCPKTSTTCTAITLCNAIGASTAAGPRTRR